MQFNLINTQGCSKDLVLNFGTNFNTVITLNINVLVMPKKIGAYL